MNNWFEVINSARCMVSPLAIAALSHTQGTEKIGEDHFILTLDDNGATAWDWLSRKPSEKFSIQRMLKNKENEYIQLCLFEAYLRKIIWSTRYWLQLGSWSDDVAQWVDAILQIHSTTYKMDFTTNSEKLQKKLQYISEYHKSDWILYFQIPKMSALVAEILRGYDGPYTQESLVQHIVRKKLYILTDIQVYDKETWDLPQELKKYLN